MTIVDSENTAVLAALARIETRLERIEARQQRVDAILSEASPIARAVMDTAIENFGKWDERGWFRAGRAALRIGDRVVSTYGDADYAELENSIVTVLDTLRSLSRPEMLAVVNQVASAVDDADSSKPQGMFGMMRATQEPEVKKGLALMLEVLRHLGRGVDSRANPPDRKAKLSAMLGPRLPASRPPAARVSAVAPRPAAAAPQAPRSSVAESCPAPKVAPVKASLAIDGVEFTGDAFFADPRQWNESMAQNLANQLGVGELTDAHWTLIRFARTEWEKTDASPNVRRVAVGSGISTREIYALLKVAPGITLARIAGIPKPGGCL